MIYFRKRTWKSECWSNCSNCWNFDIVSLQFCQGVMDACCPTFVDKTHVTLLHHFLVIWRYIKYVKELSWIFRIWWYFDVWRMYIGYYDVLPWMHRFNFHHQWCAIETIPQDGGSDMPAQDRHIPFCASRTAKQRNHKRFAANQGVEGLHLLSCAMYILHAWFWPKVSCLNVCHCFSFTMTW